MKRNFLYLMLATIALFAAVGCTRTESIDNNEIATSNFEEETEIEMNVEITNCTDKACSIYMDKMQMSDDFELDFSELNFDVGSTYFRPFKLDAENDMEIYIYIADSGDVSKLICCNTKIEKSELNANVIKFMWDGQNLIRK